MTTIWPAFRRGLPGNAQQKKTMAEIINLRRARKSKARREHEKAASANRAQFGTARHERELARSQSEKSAREIEAHKLVDDKS